MWPAIALVGAGCIGASYYKRYRADQQFVAEVSRARDEARRIEREVVRFTKRTLPSGGSFAAFLGSLGIDSPSASRMVASAQPVFDHAPSARRQSSSRSAAPFSANCAKCATASNPAVSFPSRRSGERFPFRHRNRALAHRRSRRDGRSATARSSRRSPMRAKNPNSPCASRKFSAWIWISTPTRARATRSAWSSRKRSSKTARLASYGRILAAEYNNGRPLLSRHAVPRIHGHRHVLQTRRHIDEESVPAFAAEIRCAHHFAFQPQPLPSDPEGISPAPRNRLRRAHGHTRADHRRRQA